MQLCGFQCDSWVKEKGGNQSCVMNAALQPPVVGLSAQLCVQIQLDVAQLKPILDSLVGIHFIVKE